MLLLDVSLLKISDIVLKRLQGIDFGHGLVLTPFEVDFRLELLVLHVLSLPDGHIDCPFLHILSLPLFPELFRLLEIIPLLLIELLPQK